LAVISDIHVHVHISVTVVPGLMARRSGFDSRQGNGGDSLPLRHCIQTCSGDHPTSYPMGTGESFLGGKAAETWSWPRSSI